MAHPPPGYENHPLFAASVSSLPAYTRRRPLRPPTARREPTEHVFDLKNKHGIVWASLKLSSGARSSENLPTYLEGETIKGSFKLGVDRPDGIRFISITAKGEIITGNQPEDTVTFLDYRVTLYSKDGSDNGASSSSSQPPQTGKLQGEYTWPLHITLPREVMSSPTSGSSNGSGSSGNSLQPYRLPQTFVERHTRASVQYSIIAHIARTKFRSDSKIRTLFIYVPTIQPGPPSVLRQIAYQENSPILGPNADPEGWKTFDPMKVRGRIFSTRQVELQVTVSLANPLSYTRGLAIPCHLVISCPDLQALDLLATSKSITLCLRRTVKPAEGYAQAEHDNWHSVRQDCDEDICYAVWWPSKEGSPLSPSSTKRVLDGEIKLAKGLKPSCAIAHFSVKYHIIWLPFRAAAFTALKPEPSLRQLVEIATVYPPGPHPRCYSPPEYDTPQSQPRPRTGGSRPSTAHARIGTASAPAVSISTLWTLPT